MWHYGVTQSQHCNDFNDDNMMRQSMWFEFFDGLVSCQIPWYMGRTRDNKEWNSNKEHQFPWILGYKRRGDIKEVDITEFRVYLQT